MQGDTFLVEVFVKGGCSPKQAAAFERFLEDNVPCGVGAQRMNDVLLTLMQSQYSLVVAALNDLRQENKRLVDMIWEEHTVNQPLLPFK